MLYATHSAALWLLFLVYFVSPIIAPCTICFGAGVPDGCTGDPNTCPWGTAIAANVAAISAGLGGTLTVARVLPSKITRFLSKSILDSISALASRVSPGTTYNPTSKTANEIAKAVKLGLFQKDFRHGATSFMPGCCQGCSMIEGRAQREWAPIPFVLFLALLSRFSRFLAWSHFWT